MRTNLLLILALSSVTVQLWGQSQNPFELLWRKDSVGVTGHTEAKSTPAPVIEPSSPEPPAQIIQADTASAGNMQTDTSGQESVSGKSIFDKSTEAAPPVENASPESTAQPQKEAAETIPGDTGKPLRPSAPLALILIFGIIFALLAWVMSLNRDLLKKIYRAAFNENFSALLFREQRFATTQYLYYIVYAAFFINGGVFLFLISREFGWTAWVFRSVWSCIGLVTVIYLLRHLSLNILGNTYPVTKETTHFSFSILLHNILLGIGLIPVNLLLAYGPHGLAYTVAILGLVLCGLAYLMRQFRGLVIGGSLIGTNPFHFFIYLCAVEILPLFTLVKFFHN